MRSYMADTHYTSRVDSEGDSIPCSRCGSECPTLMGRERPEWNEPEEDFYWCVYCYETSTIGPAIQYPQTDHARCEVAKMLAEGFNLLERQIKAHIDANKQ